jgi:hypothetical protein
MFMIHIHVMFYHDDPCRDNTKEGEEYECDDRTWDNMHAYWFVYVRLQLYIHIFVLQGERGTSTYNKCTAASSERGGYNASPQNIANHSTDIYT